MSLAFGLLPLSTFAACAGVDAGSAERKGAPVEQPAADPAEEAVESPAASKEEAPPKEVAPAPKPPQPFAVRAERSGGVVLDENFPDPFVLSVGDTWLAYGTNTHGMNVPVFDPARDGPLFDALPDQHLGAWARRGVSRVWAPAVAETADGGYALYYSAEEIDTGLMGIGVATADDPRGPFVDERDRPLLTVRSGQGATVGGAIDASTFTEGGRTHLVWKNDGNSGGAATNIWRQRLSPDGRTLEGQPVAILGEAGHEAWEVAGYTAPRPLIEGPVLTKENGKYFLFYSANDWHSDRYGINYATSDSLDGPFVRAPGPWLQSHGDRSGPGGQELFRDRDGKTWMTFHAWEPERPGYDVGGKRRLVVAPVDFSSGAPKLAEG